MNRKKCIDLIKILIISIIKSEKDLTDFIISCNKNKNLISIIAERKNDTMPLTQVIDILELTDEETDNFIYDIYSIVNNPTYINTKVEKLIEKYEKKLCA